MRNRRNRQAQTNALQLDLDLFGAGASGALDTPSPRRVLGGKPRKHFITNPDWRPFSTSALPMMPKRGATKASNPSYGRSHQRA